MAFTDTTMFFNQNISHRHHCLLNKRAPFCVSGSITIEAALAVPMFFLAIIALCYMMEVMSVRTSIRSGMQSAGKMAAREAYMKSVLIPGEIEKTVIESIGEERLEQSIIEGGSQGIRCEKSYMSPVTGLMEIRVNYRVFLPVRFFGQITVPMEESCRLKGWIGYEKTGFLHRDETVVYITETGMVYHKDYHCTYLELSIKTVPSNEVDALRNKSQGKYYPCERCTGRQMGEEVYITDYGNRYHSSLSCRGLKRTIYAVPLSEAAGKGACSKCG